MEVKKINSPCVRNCCLSEDDICLGCFRSLDEIVRWTVASEQQKQDVLELAHSRKINHQK